VRRRRGCGCQIRVLDRSEAAERRQAADTEARCRSSSRTSVGTHPCLVEFTISARHGNDYGDDHPVLHGPVHARVRGTVAFFGYDLVRAGVAP